MHIRIMNGLVNNLHTLKAYEAVVPESNCEHGIAYALGHMIALSERQQYRAAYTKGTIASQQHHGHYKLSADMVDVYCKWRSSRTDDGIILCMCKCM